MFFEAASLLKPENILAFFLRAHVPDRSHGFLLKLQWKKFGRTATSKAKPPVTDTGWNSGTDCTEKKQVSARQGERSGPEKQKAASRRGSNQELSVLVLPFENGL